MNTELADVSAQLRAALEAAPGAAAGNAARDAERILKAAQREAQRIIDSAKAEAHRILDDAEQALAAPPVPPPLTVPTPGPIWRDQQSPAADLKDDEALVSWARGLTTEGAERAQPARRSNHDVRINLAVRASALVAAALLFVLISQR